MSEEARQRDERPAEQPAQASGETLPPTVPTGLPATVPTASTAPRREETAEERRQRIADEKNEARWRRYWYYLWAGAFGVVAFGVWWFRHVQSSHHGDWDVAQYGTLGDSIAPITAVATVATFVAAAAAMLLQREYLATGAKDQANLVRQQSELVKFEQATAEAIKKSVAATQRQVDLLLAQQTALTKAFADMTTEQRRSTAVVTKDARRLVLKESAREARAHERLLFRFGDAWDKAYRNAASSGFRGVQNAPAIASSASQFLEWLEGRRAAAEASATQVDAWIVQHDAAPAGEEADHAIEVRTMRECWPSDRSQAAVATRGLAQLLQQSGGIDALLKILDDHRREAP